MRHAAPILRYAGPLALLGFGIVLFLPGGEGPVNRAATTVPAVVADEDAAVSGALLSPVEFGDLEVAETEDAAAAPAAGVPQDVPFDDATGSVASDLSETAITQTMPPDLAARDGTLVHVGGKAVNMRAGPSKDTARLLTLQPGDPVSVKEMSDNWAFVVTAAGESGWVYSSYLRDGSEPQVASAEEEPERKKPRKKDGVTAQVRGAVAVRARPSSMSERLFVIEPGEEITIVETRGRWARVVVDGGISGWVRLRSAN